MAGLTAAFRAVDCRLPVGPSKARWSHLARPSTTHQLTGCRSRTSVAKAAAFKAASALSRDHPLLGRSGAGRPSGPSTTRHASPYRHVSSGRLPVRRPLIPETRSLLLSFASSPLHVPLHSSPLPPEPSSSSHLLCCAVFLSPCLTVIVVGCRWLRPDSHSRPIRAAGNRLGLSTDDRGRESGGGRTVACSPDRRCACSCGPRRGGGQARPGCRE